VASVEEVGTVGEKGREEIKERRREEEGKEKRKQ
jgi:hypothetical protein